MAPYSTSAELMHHELRKAIVWLAKEKRADGHLSCKDECLFCGFQIKHHRNTGLTSCHCHNLLQGVMKADLFKCLLNYISARASTLEEAELVCIDLLSAEQVMM